MFYIQKGPKNPQTGRGYFNEDFRSSFGDGDSIYVVLLKLPKKRPPYNSSSSSQNLSFTCLRAARKMDWVPAGGQLVKVDTAAKLKREQVLY